MLTVGVDTDGVGRGEGMSKETGETRTTNKKWIVCKE